MNKNVQSLEFISKQKTLHPRKSELVRKITKSEECFKNRLDDLGIRYIFQKGFIGGDFYCIVDFYLPKPYKLCIEIDGGYHNSEEQKRKDWAKDKYLRGRKMRVLRIKNEDVLTADIQSLILTAK